MDDIAILTGTLASKLLYYYGTCTFSSVDSTGQGGRCSLGRPPPERACGRPESLRAIAEGRTESDRAGSTLSAVHHIPLRAVVDLGTSRH